MINVIEEKKELSAKEIEAKVKRLDIYIQRTDRLIEKQTKLLDRIRQENQKRMFLVKKGILRGKIYG